MPFVLSEPSSKSEGEEQAVSAAEVCLYGLNIVMPLMTLEMLKFPSLCLQYFRTVTLACEIYPEKVSLKYSLVIGLFVKTLFP